MINAAGRECRAAAAPQPECPQRSLTCPGFLGNAPVSRGQESRARAPCQSSLPGSQQLLLGEPGAALRSEELRGPRDVVTSTRCSAAAPANPGRCADSSQAGRTAGAASGARTGSEDKSLRGQPGLVASESVSGETLAAALPQCCWEEEEPQ